MQVGLGLCLGLPVLNFLNVILRALIRIYFFQLPAKVSQSYTVSANTVKSPRLGSICMNKIITAYFNYSVTSQKVLQNTFFEDSNFSVNVI